MLMVEVKNIQRYRKNEKILVVFGMKYKHGLPKLIIVTSFLSTQKWSLIIIRNTVWNIFWSSHIYINTKVNVEKLLVITVKTILSYSICTIAQLNLLVKR